MMQHFDDNDVNRLLDHHGVIEALRVAHTQSGMPQTRFNMDCDTQAPKNTFVTQFAWVAGDAVGVKLDGLFPDNVHLKPPLPSVQGIVLLFDGKTGMPQASCTGSNLTLYKTSADSALAADFLSRKDAQIMLMVGAGALAPHLIAAMQSVRSSLNKILVWNRHLDRACQLVERLVKEGCPAAVAPQLDEAVAQADIISCATMSTNPLIHGAFVKPGCHIDLVGAYQPQMREADDTLIRRAGRLFVNGYANCEISGDVSGPLDSGALRRDQIVADLFDPCQGRHLGRETSTEITVYKNSGGGHLDLFTIRHLLERAQIVQSQ